MSTEEFKKKEIDTNKQGTSQIKVNENTLETDAHVNIQIGMMIYKKQKTECILSSSWFVLQHRLKETCFLREHATNKRQRGKVWGNIEWKEKSS